MPGGVPFRLSRWAPFSLTNTTLTERIGISVEGPDLRYACPCFELSRRRGALRFAVVNQRVDRLGPVDAHSVDAGETQSPHANAVAQRDLFALAMTIVSRALPPSVYHVDVPDQGLW